MEPLEFNGGPLDGLKLLLPPTEEIVPAEIQDLLTGESHTVFEDQLPDGRTVYRHYHTKPGEEMKYERTSFIHPDEDPGI
jgi:hypothetical protein